MTTPTLSSLSLTIAGVSLPIVSIAIAVACVVVSRSIAPRSDPPVPRWKHILTTIALLWLACAWVIETRPGTLFTTIVSFGLGFAGYSILELAGEETKGLVRRFFEMFTPKGGPRA